jgi:hypothetical protein
MGIGERIVEFDCLPGRGNAAGDTPWSSGRDKVEVLGSSISPPWGPAPLKCPIFFGSVKIGQAKLENVGARVAEVIRAR